MSEIIKPTRKPAAEYAYSRYKLVPGPKNKNSISDMKVIKEELRKLRDVENCTGFLYFLMEYCVMKHPTKGRVKLADDIYKWQVDAAVEFLRNKFIISKKTRQTGFSSLVGAYTLWRTLFFASQNCSILSLSQRESTTFLRERYKFVYQNLPDWLRQETGEFAKMSVTFEHNGSRFTSLPQGDDPARGDSLSMLIMDEFAMYKNAEDILASATPALSAGLSQGFSNDSLPAQLFLISTLPKHPFSKNGEENKYLELLHSAQSAENEYKIIDVDTSDIPHYLDENWHKRMLDTLGPRRYAIEVKGQEVYDTDNMVIPHYLYDYIKIASPIRCDFLSGDLVSPDGMPINMDIVPFLKDDYDTEHGYVKGLWFFEEPKEKHEYCCTCLPIGERVLTIDGYKKVEDVTLQDILYDINGKQTKIVNTQNRKAAESIFSIKVENIYRETKYTGEHPIFASKSKIVDKEWEHDFKFYKANEVEKGDWLYVPNIYFEEKTSKEYMLDTFLKYKTSKEEYDLPDGFIFDEEIWWYIGLWIAEGHLSRQKEGKHKSDYRVSTTHSLIKEKYIFDKIKTIFSKYDRSTIYDERTEGNSFQVHIYSKQLHQFILDVFGRGSSNKQIPEWVKFMPKQYRRKLLEGYILGDGCICFNDKCKKPFYKMTCTSVSLKLLEDIQDILFSLGIRSHISLNRLKGKTKIKGIECNTKEAYYLQTSKSDTIELTKQLGLPNKVISSRKTSIGHCHFTEDKKFILMRIKNVTKSKYKGLVYNFETEAHTYMCDHIPVHNCDVSTGRAGDFSTILVWDLITNAQVAEYRGKINTELFKDLILRLCNIYNNAKLSIESTGLGGPVAEYFATGISYEGMYWHKYSRKTYKPGFPMSPSNKANGIALMQSYLAKDLPAGTITIRSQRLMNEMRSFGYTKAGKIQALAGHDDLIMALVQYISLKHLGWATSDAAFIRDTLGTDEDEEEEAPVKIAENIQKNRIKKYWEENGGFDEEEVDMMSDMIKSMGLCVGG